jgi:hypothetical protein
MKILLGLNNQLNSNIFGSRFIKNSKFKFKVLGHSKNNHQFKIDYTLDDLYGNDFYFDQFGFEKGVKFDSKKWIMF